MIKTGIKEARQHLPSLLSKVQGGEEVLITKRGEAVAKVTTVTRRKAHSLGSHQSLRDTLPRKGEPLSAVVTALRDKERS